LISDLWDQSAAHLGLLCHDEIVGVIRFARPVNGKLPLHEHMTVFMAPEPVREISRVVIHRRTAPVRATLYSRRAFLTILAAIPVIWSWTLSTEWGAHVRGHLIRIGFTDTGLRYWDERYAAQSSILWGREEDVIMHFKNYFEDVK
jgi:hypothetical protein